MQKYYSGGVLSFFDSICIYLGITRGLLNDKALYNCFLFLLHVKGALCINSLYFESKDLCFSIAGVIQVRQLSVGCK